MEGLTKQQIVLVTLLVSFVTSVATGIVTVALMDQAPPGVTQTINRVVERTVEKVVPNPNQAAAVVTKETVVVKEDDLVIQAVEKNAKSLVSITKVSGEGEAKTETFAGNGLVLSKEGLMASDSSVAAPALDDNGNPLQQSLKAVLADGAALPLTVVSADNATGLIFLKPTLDDKTKNTVFIPATIADAGSLKLGQTVIALGGEKVSVATGIVSNLSQSEQKPVSQDGAATSTSKSSTGQIIKTDISAPAKALGAILVNLSGDVVGIRALTAGSADNLFLAASLVAKALGK
ncbi:MAG: trypsin-like peptidase domain-containing protein [Candidatus Taylorbacteria bacterium]|nr:trypsin-like peptidase domain-containing protein [Candidatus Taylorbacteria bacterium]